MSETIPYFERLKLIKQGLLPKEAVAKKKVPLKKVSEKRKAELSIDGGYGALDIWFEERRKEMTGVCVLCGGKTERDNDETYRRSVHHLFEKRPAMFPSVALHAENFLEVCFWGNSCHTNLHNGTITWELLMDSAEREMILDKCKKIIPFIAESERKNIPEIILKHLTNE